MIKSLKSWDGPNWNLKAKLKNDLCLKSVWSVFGVPLGRLGSDLRNELLILDLSVLVFVKALE